MGTMRTALQDIRNRASDYAVLTALALVVVHFHGAVSNAIDIREFSPPSLSYFEHGYVNALATATINPAHVSEDNPAEYIMRLGVNDDAIDIIVNDNGDGVPSNGDTFKVQPSNTEGGLHSNRGIALRARNYDHSPPRDWVETFQGGFMARETDALDTGSNRYGGDVGQAQVVREGLLRNAFELYRDSVRTSPRAHEKGIVG